tara:strand:+ start:14 stop:766 length:753 start_codon:yes stop_codon:yes gene_type:complete
MKSVNFENGIMYHGDCLNVLSTLNDNSAMIAVTSPPYNLGRCLKEKQTNQQIKKRFDKWYEDYLCKEVYQNQQKQVLTDLSRVCMSSIFYNHRIQYQWHKSFKNIRNQNMINHPYDWIQDFKIWSIIIWDRLGVGLPQKNRFHSQYEHIYQINRPTFFDNTTLKLTNIWRIPPTKNNLHPCSFPAKLVNNCILPTTTKNQIVIDPYMGSGTTAIQAIKTGRRFIGIERDKKFFDFCCDRISDEERQYTLF